MRTPLCITPGNPDVTGIGVRLALYIQSFSIVFVSLLTSNRLNPQPTLSAAWRVQFYYTLAIILATLIQRFQDQISLFHEFAAFNLAYISLMSGVAALGTSSTVVRNRRDVPFGAAARGQRLVMIPSSRPLSRPQRTVWIATNAPQTALLMVQGGRIVLMGLLVGETFSLSKGCVMDSNADAANLPSNEPNVMRWWFLGIRINLVSHFYLVLVVFLLDSFLRAFNFIGAGMKLIFGSTGGSRLVRHVIDFVVLVVGIEVSIGINRLDGVENSLGFGQVIPLVLLIPILEAWWDAIFGKDEPMKENSTPPPSHSPLPRAPPLSSPPQTRRERGVQANEQEQTLRCILDTSISSDKWAEPESARVVETLLSPDLDVYLEGKQV